MVKLYVEGGGNTSALKSSCREGFRTFITKAGLEKQPRIVACGGRDDAYHSYCTAIKNGEAALLLVDSEATVPDEAQAGEPDKWQPWMHLAARKGDGWKKPSGAPDTDCHLMVQCMESWLLADRDTLKKFFGHGFAEKKLPSASTKMEEVEKAKIYTALAEATKDCKTKPQYGKGEHSFVLLALIDPSEVTKASPWAKRFIDQLGETMG